MRQHFGVRVPSEHVTAGFEVTSELMMVVDLAIERDPDGSVSFAIGFAPAGDRSMMLSRVWIRVASGHKRFPWASGPRWRKACAMRSPEPTLSDRVPNHPVIPHMIRCPSSLRPDRRSAFPRPNDPIRIPALPWLGRLPPYGGIDRGCLSTLTCG